MGTATGHMNCGRCRLLGRGNDECRSRRRRSNLTATASTSRTGELERGWAHLLPPINEVGVLRNAAFRCSDEGPRNGNAGFKSKDEDSRNAAFARTTIDEVGVSRNDGFKCSEEGPNADR